jgi:hypothetical protein
MMNCFLTLLSNSTCAATRCEVVSGDARVEDHCHRDRGALHGRVVQLDPIKRTLKAPGTKRLKLAYDGMLSHFGFKIKLRRYIMVLFHMRHAVNAFSRVRSLLKPSS